MFVAFYQQLQAFNIMQVSTQQSAILSAIIFNALIIIALIPLALKGVKYRPIGAGPLLQRNLLIYGVGGVYPNAAVPIDLVTTSCSRLDPDISPEATLFQVPRVAEARNIPKERIRALVNEHIGGRTLGLLGEARVNVLQLNLALDEAAK